MAVVSTNHNHMQDPFYLFSFPEKSLRPMAYGTIIIIITWKTHFIFFYFQGNPCGLDGLWHNHNHNHIEDPFYQFFISREILAAYGGVHLEDIRGMRAPFLAIGVFIFTLKNITMMVMQSRNEEDVDEKTNVLHVVDDFNQLVR